jgi:hypothetical protein
VAARRRSRGRGPSGEQQGIKRDGIRIPKISRRARFARGASRPLLAGSVSTCPHAHRLCRLGYDLLFLRKLVVMHLGQLAAC